MANGPPLDGRGCMFGMRPDMIPSPPLLNSELEKAKLDCSTIDLPFHRVTALINGLYKRRVLGGHKPTLRRTLYTVFNLETTLSARRALVRRRKVETCCRTGYTSRTCVASTST